MRFHVHYAAVKNVTKEAVIQILGRWAHLCCCLSILTWRRTSRRRAGLLGRSGPAQQVSSTWSRARVCFVYRARPAQLAFTTSSPVYQRGNKFLSPPNQIKADQRKLLLIPTSSVADSEGSVSFSMIRIRDLFPGV
jgi:hypothetical protein